MKEPFYSNLKLDGTYQICFGSSWHRNNQYVELNDHTNTLLMRTVSGKPYHIGELYFKYRGELCPCFIKRK